MLWSNQMLDVTAAVSTRLSFWGFGFFTWIPSTWHSPWSMVNTTGWLNQSTLGGSCFKAQLELGLNWWWWEQSRSGSMWPHSSVLLFFNSSFRALYTRLNFHNTENLGFFFFSSASYHWNQNCPKEQLSNSSGSCGLEGAAIALQMRFLTTHRLQWGCNNFMVMCYGHCSKPAWKLWLSPAARSFAGTAWVNCQPLCHILSRPERLLSITHRFFWGEAS